MIDSFIEQYAKEQIPIQVDFKKLVPKIVKPERYTHLIHFYPAKLLVNIPYYILETERLCPKGGLVLDPFCGSGTVLLESILSGRNSIGADANPIARLISEAKTHFINPTQLELDLAKILSYVEKEKKVVITDFPNKDYWFSSHVQKQLALLLTAIRRIRKKDSKSFFMVCFSNIVKKVSYADPNIYVPVKINPERFIDKPDIYQKLRIKIDSLINIDVFDRFKKVSIENIERMRSLQGTDAQNYTAKVVSKDARRLTRNITNNSLLEDGCVDLVLTSPPYAGAQKYIRSSRLSLNWFGLGSAENIRNLEKINIGREDFAKKDLKIEKTGIQEADALIKKIAIKDKTRATIASTYLREMNDALKESIRVLKKDGYMVLIVGPNKVCGYDFDTPRFLRLIAENYGMHTELVMIDSIKKYGMLTMRNKNSGLIQTEWVMILKK